MVCYICGNDCTFDPNPFDGGIDPDTGYRDEVMLCDHCASVAMDRGTLNLSVSITDQRGIGKYR